MWLKRRNFPHHYIYVHENARDRGFHSHLLMYFSPFSAVDRGDFREWARKFFRRRCGQLPSRAVRIQFRDYGDREKQVKLQWILFRYLCKGLDPRIRDRGEKSRPQPLTKLLRLKPIPANEVGCGQRCGCSHSLGPAAREVARAKEPMRASAYDRRAWDDLYTGWELKQGDTRALLRPLGI
jgi:hypothetical protein